MKLDAQLRAAGVPIHGCTSKGRIDFREEASANDRAYAAAILAAHDPTPDPAPPSVEERLLEFEARLAKLETRKT